MQETVARARFHKKKRRKLKGSEQPWICVVESALNFRHGAGRAQPGNQLMVKMISIYGYIWLPLSLWSGTPTGTSHCKIGDEPDHQGH